MGFGLLSRNFLRSSSRSLAPEAMICHATNPHRLLLGFSLGGCLSQAGCHACQTLVSCGLCQNTTVCSCKCNSFATVNCLSACLHRMSGLLLKISRFWDSMLVWTAFLGLSARDCCIQRFVFMLRYASQAKSLVGVNHVKSGLLQIYNAGICCFGHKCLAHAALDVVGMDVVGLSVIL